MEDFHLFVGRGTHSDVYLHFNEEQAERVRNMLAQFGFSQIGDAEYSFKLDREVRL